ncbi:simple sugar transport system ATP-binding protein [Tindallia magadiensis]|uniref:Simple sugar transport system ATP-binding protein n=1 Tax=Tindallia magadiensis TaxID=69895 RepID=A0A1I3AQM6_9FIRM|nr:ABC transporter ATP-binding protein [Tindallia magadiensis]SFH52377.1 simple sugar transport system ATP-binding protein [Tindallia magadiensis]
MEEILSMQGITKVYPNGVMANKDVNFSVRKGEIHAVMGENGAGKSTLMKILFGMEQPEEGKIIYKGEEINFTSSSDAINYGIGMVHQHFMLVPSLTVAENMVMGIEPRKKNIFFDYDQAIKMTEDVSKKYNLKIDPKAVVDTLAVGKKQKIEILKALVRGAEILILDEPTAVLTPQETKELFEELINLKEQGFTIIFISHKLKEVKQITDRLTILRNGRSMGVHNTKDTSEQEISRLMVGRDVMLKVEKSAAKLGSSVMRMEDVSYHSNDGTPIVKDVTMEIKEGQIMGIAGVEGNGQGELVDLLTGMKKASDGKIWINDTIATNLSVKEVRDLKVSHIPEDRMTYGASGDSSIEENIISDRFAEKKYNKGLLMNVKQLTQLAKELISDYNIKCASEKQQVRMLSGGNIQKVVVAREFSSEPKLIIANQPTRGIDVGSTEFIRKQLVKLRDEGAAVLLVSADLNEVMELSDSLMVMYEGEIVAYFEDATKVNEMDLGMYMLGLKRMSEEEMGV